MVYLLLLAIVFATALFYLLVRRVSDLSGGIVPDTRITTVTDGNCATWFYLKQYRTPRRRSSAARTGAALPPRDRRGRFSSRRRGADRDTIL